MVLGGPRGPMATSSMLLLSHKGPAFEKKLNRITGKDVNTICDFQTRALQISNKGFRRRPRNY